MGARAPLGDTRLLLGVGLPNPALQALCKLITASETGEQLISRVSGAGQWSPGLSAGPSWGDGVPWPTWESASDRVLLPFSASVTRRERRGLGVKQSPRRAPAQGARACPLWALGSERGLCHLQSQALSRTVHSVASCTLSPPAPASFFRCWTSVTATLPQPAGVGPACQVPCRVPGA